MSQIAVILNENSQVKEIAEFPYSMSQKASDGWRMVEKDVHISNDNCTEWTIRDDDNKLVHISTGLTPDEENKKAISELTKNDLNGQLTNAQLQDAITALTKQNLQLTQDNGELKTAVTALTQQVANSQLSNTSNEETK